MPRRPFQNPHTMYTITHNHRLPGEILGREHDSLPKGARMGHGGLTAWRRGQTTTHASNVATPCKCYQCVEHVSTNIFCHGFEVVVVMLRGGCCSKGRFWGRLVGTGEGLADPPGHMGGQILG